MSDSPKEVDSLLRDSDDMRVRRIFGFAFVFLLRSWFNFTFATIVTSTSFATTLVGFMPAAKRERVSRFLAVVGAKLIFLLNPHIRITDATVPNSIELFDKDDASTLLLNHSSTLDSFVLFSALPLYGSRDVKVLAKTSLFELPIFGRILKACGHFPVHYVCDSRVDDFSVDKVAQKSVMRDVENHVEDGGILALFPEGQINRRDTRVLQPFRHGSLALARKHDKRVWGFVHVGIDTTWPTTHAIGGFPSEVRYKFFKIPDAATDVSTEMYAKHVKDVMQTELNSLYEN